MYHYLLFVLRSIFFYELYGQISVMIIASLEGSTEKGESQVSLPNDCVIEGSRKLPTYPWNFFFLNKAFP